MSSLCRRRRIDVFYKYKQNDVFPWRRIPPPTSNPSGQLASLSCVAHLLSLLLLFLSCVRHMLSLIYCPSFAIPLLCSSYAVPHILSFFCYSSLVFLICYPSSCYSLLLSLVCYPRMLSLVCYPFLVSVMCYSSLVLSLYAVCMGNRMAMRSNRYGLIERILIEYHGMDVNLSFQ